MAESWFLDDEGPSDYSLAILAALQKKQHVYMGTVSASTKNRRRAKNRVARKNRRINRGH